MSGPSQLHEHLVAKVVADGATRTGFMQAMEELAIRIGFTRRGWRDDSARCRVIPDAFRVDEEQCGVIVYEVEITSHLTEAKMARYIELLWLIDQYGWSLVIVRIAPNGEAIAADPFWHDLERLAA